MTIGEISIFLLGIAVVVGSVAAVYIIKLREKMEKLQARMDKMLSSSKLTTWENKKTGLYSEVLGRFGLMSEYKQLAVIGSSSENFSLDMIGVKDDSVDYIEFKQKRVGKRQGKLSDGEELVKKLIDEKKVKYIIKDVEWPEWFEIKDREIKKKMKKKKN